MSQHSAPIVPTVLYIADQQYAWKLAAYERLATTYHTPTTVFLASGAIDKSVRRIVGKNGVVKQQTAVYCIPDDAAWERVQTTRAQLQQHIDAFAAGLRDLGSYAFRLAAWKGAKTTPNPLTATVITVTDPDDDERHYFVSNPIPRLDRRPIARHTPKMLGAPGDYVFSQRHTFVCPDDAAWETIQEHRDAAQRAYEEWKRLLRELGTYQAALADGRYAKKETAMEIEPSATAASLALPPTEAAELTRCEAIIERGVQTFIEVGEALQTIRNGKLYRAAHKTFDDYCRDRWGIGASRARQLIGASEVAQHVESVTTVTLSSETHARPLVGLAPDQQIVAAQRAVAIAGDAKPTAQHYQQAATEIKPKPLACVRCGAELSPARGLTTYGEGLVPEYPGRAVTLCSVCIPELLHVRANPTRSELAPMTPDTRDADGPWFWASKSVVHPTAHCWHKSNLTGGYVSACGLEAPQQPTSGAKGIHCSVCETHADRRQIVPIPGSEPPAAPNRLTCPTCGEPILNGIWGELKECGSCHQARQRAAHHAAPLTRPRRPVSADVSAQLAYLGQLEAYTQADDTQRLAAAAQSLVGDVELFVRQAQIMVAEIDQEGCATLASAIRALTRLIAPDAGMAPPAMRPEGIRAALARASELAGDDLTALADQLDDATYEALAAYRRARESVGSEASV